MIEADILLGTVAGGDGVTVPIMAHPPHLSSDLSFSTFLAAVVAHNAAAAAAFRVGVKLDFKVAMMGGRVIQTPLVSIFHQRFSIQNMLSGD
jgi:hypothetical protein